MVPSDDPILADAKTVRPLSGARVVLMTKDDRHWFVRKIARDPTRSDRLRRQMAKQIAFSESVADAVMTPRVLDQGELEGRFYFDMEFVRGTDGVTFLRRASYADVTALADRLCAYVHTVAQQPPDHANGDSLFQALYSKLCEVQRKTSAIDSGTLAQLFIALEHLRQLGDGMRPTLCHGDLTLENIVIDDQRRVWMLDLLDAPFEHYWQDVSKLHQDLAGGWYLLGQATIARCVLDYLSRRLLDTTVQLDARYAEIHPVLLACTFVRILPYVRTAEEQEFVKQRVEHFARLADRRNP